MHYIYVFQGDFVWLRKRNQMNKLLKDTLIKLNDSEKIEAIELLSDCLNKPDKEVEKLIAKESEKRFKDYKSGKIKSKTLSSVLKKIE
jgi:hypothetical protein